MAATGQRFRAPKRSVIPGFSLSLGFTIAYLGLIVLIPLGALVLKSAGLGGLLAARAG